MDTEWTANLLRPRLVWKRYGHALPTELAGAGDALSAFRRSRALPV